MTYLADTDEVFDLDVSVTRNPVTGTLQIARGAAGVTWFKDFQGRRLSEPRRRAWLSTRRLLGSGGCWRALACDLHRRLNAPRFGAARLRVSMVPCVSWATDIRRPPPELRASLFSI
jgi:hypothetical protein